MTRHRIAIALGVLSPGCLAWAPIHPAVFDGREISLRYEGSCAHLACCSRYAVAVSAGAPGAYDCGSDQMGVGCEQHVGWFTPAFTCDPDTVQRYRQPRDAPYSRCNDRERWLSLPGLTRAQCGQTYLVCYRGERVTATVRDRSASNDSGNAHFEGSWGLLHAIGADPAERETFVSIYALHERDRIAADPHCVGSGR